MQVLVSSAQRKWTLLIMFSLRKCCLCLIKLNNTHFPPIYTLRRGIKRWVAPTLKELKRRKFKMGPEPLQHRSTFLEWNYPSEIFAFGRRLGEDLREDLLKRALTHRSYVLREEARQRDVGIEEPRMSGLEDNRALAASGEALASLYLKQHLRTALPRLPEEGICSVHDYLMSDRILGQVSANIGTTDLILCSDFPVEQATLALTLKAVIGALAEGSGVSRAKLFVRDFVLTQLSGLELAELWLVPEPIRTLEAVLEKEGRGKPEPRLIGRAGSNTILASYQVGMYSDRLLVGTGSGESVEIAKEMAARDALSQMFWIAENTTPFPFRLELEENQGTEANATLKQWVGCSPASLTSQLN